MSAFGYAARRLLVVTAVFSVGASLGAPLIRAQEAPKESMKDVSKDTASYTWAFARKQGEVLRFRLHQTLAGELPGNKEFNADIKTTVRRDVKSVSDTGDATVEETTETRKRVINGAVYPEDPSGWSKITQVVTRAGLLREQSINGVPLSSNPASVADKLSQLGAMLSQTVAPSASVTMGATWKTELPNRLVPGKTIVMTSKLESKGHVAGVETLHITFSMEIPTIEHASPVDTMDLTGEYDVDPKAGLLMLSKYKVDNVELPLKEGSIKVTSNARVELVVPGVNDKEDNK